MRPYELNNSSNQTTVYDLPASQVREPRFLPEILIRARAAVFDRLNCLDLNITARRTLFGILTFVQAKDPSRSIFPRRETLRIEAQLSSDATLYRGLKTLEELGYIEREQIRKARNGKYHTSPITLLEKARALLGLDEVIHKRPSSKMRDGHIKEHTNKDKQSLQKTIPQENSQKKEVSIDTASRLPADLTWLLDLGISKPAICKLMVMARSANKRLSDVSAVVRKNIEQLKGREVFAYLRDMIARDIDFAWLAKGEQAERVAEQRTTEAKAALNRFDARYHGWRVLLANGESLGVFQWLGEGATQMIMREDGRGSMPVNLAVAQAWIDGRIHFQAPDAEY